PKHGVGAAIASAEADLLAIDVHEARIRDGNAVRIAPEVREHLVGAAEGALRVHHPVLAIELANEPAKRFLVGIEMKLPRRPEYARAVEELAAKALGHRLDGEQEPLRRGHPLAASEVEAAAGDDAMHVGMQAQIACPRVQHGGDSELRRQLAAAEIEQR